MSLMSSSAAGNSYRQYEPHGLEVNSGRTRRAAYFDWKVAIDLVIASLLLVPAGAMTAMLVLLVRATSKGPGIFQQVRVGRDGRPFRMYKIRTMRVDAEVESGPEAGVRSGFTDPLIFLRWAATGCS